jgi:hypothetical protein
VIGFDFDFFAKKTKIKPNHRSLPRSFQGGATIWDAPLNIQYWYFNLVL